MNYKLRFWHELFQNLIGVHLVNGCHFDGFLIKGEGNSFMQLERLDYSATSPEPFLRYTFKSPEGGDIIYSVNNKPDGGMETVVDRVRDANGVIQLLDGPNLIAEEVMQDVYLHAVKLMATIWYT
ncbi:hypothetical protein ST201phi2-1p067 [Pseudomonas phage 201phi2-1]|uniref:Uncharacterized protein n=1 Tax=Pseudomonas phage 201phi2-1 TaxID=198110 RepID=B3FK42_BP201|nr:hypothetical protein ST201phi2-1p067 [Pseudomonas phage 201phi2-1]ABY62900.1 hypothetical protein 201phi2-1p067 [Pseudomonas phage 201phi2-1]